LTIDIGHVHAAYERVYLNLMLKNNHGRNANILPYPVGECSIGVKESKASNGPDIDVGVSKPVGWRRDAPCPVSA